MMICTVLLHDGGCSRPLDHLLLKPDMAAVSDGFLGWCTDIRRVQSL